MNMKTVKLEETKNQKRLHIGSYFVDLNESEYQELVKIFSGKSPSPVSQQLTRQKVKELFVEKGLASAHSAFALNTKYREAVEGLIDAICQLSVSPDAQKEIGCNKLQDSPEFLKGMIESLEEDAQIKDKEIDELKAEMSVLREMNNGYAKEREELKIENKALNVGLGNQKVILKSCQEQLTSKESDVERAVEALEVIRSYAIDGHISEITAIKMILATLQDKNIEALLKGNK